MEVGRVGNLLLWGTLPIRCPLCKVIVEPGEVHRHDGPIEVTNQDEPDDVRRYDELWIEVEPDA